MYIYDTLLYAHMPLTNQESSIGSRACPIFYDVGQEYILANSLSWLIKPFQTFCQFQTLKTCLREINLFTTCHEVANIYSFR
jgi:hypothetical protein